MPQADNPFHPGADKPDFLANTTREMFEARCHAVYDGLSREEVKYVLTAKQFEALDLVFYKGMGQNEAARRLNGTQHMIVVRLRSAAKRVEKWKSWKATEHAKNRNAV
jgi:predicted DNA-binding protein (UPF0251 family)